MNKIFGKNNKTLLLAVVVLITSVSCLVAKNYKGAEYRTIDSFLYGRFEVRYLPPAGSGALASFFTYHDFESSSEWNEIDIEILGRYDHDLQTTSIGPNQKIRHSHQWLDFNPHEDFHVYAFEWTPDYIAWFVDGQEIYRQEGEFISDFKYPQKIMMNIWNQEYQTWSGPWFDEQLPLRAYYDYVSYASYTPDSGNCGTNNNFTLQWKDDFDEWDQSRWEKATHTFPGNLCDFEPENIVFRDGYMILCLTDPEHLGGIDVQPPAMLYVWGIEDQVFVRFNENIDTTSAKMVTNYTIPGCEILKAELLDERTVKLTTNHLEAGQSYNLACLNIQDLNDPPNKLIGQVKTFQAMSYPDFPWRINNGSTDTVNGFWTEQIWQTNKLYGHEDGYSAEWDQHPDIKNTEMDSIFWTELHELVNYKVHVPSGQYRVTMWFCENKYQDAGQRVFDVLVNGQKIAADLDPVKQFGYQTAGKIVADTVAAIDGLLTIHFTAKSGETLLNAIEIEPLFSEIQRAGNEFVPEQFLVLHAYPNPFNSSVKLQLNVKKSGQVKIEIFNIQGQKVWVRSLDFMAPGLHVFLWKPTLSSGLYFARAFLNGKLMVNKKLMLIK